MELSKRELQIMKVMWHSDVPLASAAIKSRSPDEVRKLYSINKILNQLIEKSVVEVHGVVKNGRHIARTFIPTLSYKDYCDAYFAKQDQEDLPVLLSSILKNVDGNHTSKLREIFADWEKSRRAKPSK